MKEVLFIYFRYPLYPGGCYFQEFLNKLSGALSTIYLVASRHPKGAFKKPENLEIRWIPFLKLKFIEDIYFMVAALFRVMFTRELQKVDLVNIIGPRGLLAGWYLKKFHGIPLVCTIEILNERGSLVHTIYYELFRLLMRRAPVDKFICWSNYYWEKHLSEWGIQKNKVVIIPAGIDMGSYQSDMGAGEIKKRYAPNDQLIVFAKPLYTENTDSAGILVRAVAMLMREVKVKVLIGSGEGEYEIRKLSEDVGIGDLIDFMPPTLFSDIPKYVAAADLVVLPYKYAATTSRSLLEAMAAGKPIITAPVGEVGIILKDGENAILVNPEPALIAAAIKALLGDRKLSDKIAVNARALVEGKFSLQAVVRQTISTYESCMGQNI